MLPSVARLSFLCVCCHFRPYQSNIMPRAQPSASLPSWAPQLLQGTEEERGPLDWIDVESPVGHDQVQQKARRMGLPKIPEVAAILCAGCYPGNPRRCHTPWRCVYQIDQINKVGYPAGVLVGSESPVNVKLLILPCGSRCWPQAYANDGFYTTTEDSIEIYNLVKMPWLSPCCLQLRDCLSCVFVVILDPINQT